MFTHVSIQEMDPKCQVWKSTVTAAQTALNNAGKVVRQAIADLQVEIDHYEAKLEESCDKNCHLSK